MIRSYNANVLGLCSLECMSMESLLNKMTVLTNANISIVKQQLNIRLDLSNLINIKVRWRRCFTLVLARHRVEYDGKAAP